MSSIIGMCSEESPVFGWSNPASTTVGLAGCMGVFCSHYTSGMLRRDSVLLTAAAAAGAICGKSHVFAPLDT